MTTYFTENFAGADGTTLPAYSWARVFPTILSSLVSDATIRSSRARAETAVPQERAYRAIQFAGYTNYKARGNCIWSSPKTQARRAGVGVRMMTTQGYYLQVNSNINDPLVQLRRYSQGTWTTLVPWKPVTAASQGVVAESMVNGADIELGVRNTLTGVRLVGRVAGVDVCDYLDDSASQINGGGSAGVWYGGYATGAQVAFNDFVVLDFEEEVSEDVDVTTGLALMVNGDWYDEQGWQALGIDVLSAEASYEAGGVGGLKDRNLFNSPALYVGAEVAIRYNNTIISSGVIRRASHTLNPLEGTLYEIVSWKQIAQEVPITDDYSGAGSILFNPLDAELVDRDPAKSNREGLADNRKTIGQMIEHIADTHADGDGMLRDLGCAPPSGSVWDTVGGSLPSAVMTAKPANVNVGGSVVSAIETLLGYYPEYGWRILPGTKQWRIFRRSTAAVRDIDLAAVHAVGEMIEDTSTNHTAVLFRGSRPEAPIAEVGYLGGKANKGWPSSLEGSHSPDKQWRSGNTTTISGNGVDGPTGKVKVTLVTGAGFTMAAGEWTKARAVIAAPDPAAGTYSVYSNSSTELILDRESFIGGGVPANGAKITLGADASQDGKGNNYNDVFKTFELPDGQGFLNGACVKAKVITGSPEGGTIEYETGVTIKNPSDGSAATATLDTPALQPLQLLGFSAGGGACDTPGNLEMADDIIFKGPIIPDLSTPTVPTKRVPAVGFRGTAYSQDSAQWNGGGYPAITDARCRRVLTIDDPGYEGDLEDAEYEALGDAILAAYGTLGRQARITLAGIDLTWADIESRATLSHTGGRTTGWESLTDLWQIGVTYDFVSQTTTIWFGTIASMGKFDIGKQRQLFTEQTKYDFLRAQAAAFQELMDCLQQSYTGGQVAGAGNPNPICAEQIAEIGGGSIAGASDHSCDSLGPCEKLCHIDTTDRGLRACTTGQCGTIVNPTIFEANAVHLHVLMSQVEEPYPENYNPPGTPPSALQGVGILKEYVQTIYREFGSILTSLDKETGIGGQDLQNLKAALDPFVTCVNVQLAYLCTRILNVDIRLSAAIQCFNLALGTKVDGPGSMGNCDDNPITCEVEYCDLIWTPLMCETPCAQTLTDLTQAAPAGLSIPPAHVCEGD